MKEFAWTRSEAALFARLDTPHKVQTYLNSIAYDAEFGCRSPRFVIKEKKAHCFEGALFAAAALRMNGFPPLIVDLRAENDDDHVIAVFKQRGRWGAVAKSNFTTLRFREPVYKTVRELAMSYFDFYVNTLGDKSLRECSVPMNLAHFDRREWMTTPDDLNYIGDYLDERRHVRLLTKAQERALEPVDPALLKASLLGSNPHGLFKPSR